MYSEQSGGYEIRQYLALIWRWLWLIALATALAAGAAFFFSRHTKPIYEAATTLQVNAGQTATGMNYESFLMSERLARTYAQTLVARPVLDEASTRLSMPLESEDFTIEPVRDTQLLRLKARHSDPAIAARMANTLVQVFVEQNDRLQSERARSSREDLQDEMATMQSEIAAAQAGLEAARAKEPPEAAEIARLEGLLAQLRTVYGNLLVAREELRSAEKHEADALVVVEPAVAPTEPLLPRTLMNTLLAGVVGAMLAVGAALAIEYLDDTIRRPKDVERVAHLPTLATISRFAGPKASSAGPLMAALPGAEGAEAYRLLRTNLQFATLGRGRTAVTLLVTSAGPQEGKTTTLANLGTALAQIGKRVLLVDTDLRRPSLHYQFGLPNKAGLTTLFLEQSAEPAHVIQQTSVEGLSVLASGPIPANPAEVLSFPQSAHLLEQLKSLADYVLLDSPPALGMADAGILAARADGVLIVIESGRTRSEALRSAALFLEQGHARILGVVLNKANPRRQGHYYQHYGAEGSAPRVEPSRAAPKRKRRSRAGLAEEPAEQAPAPKPARKARTSMASDAVLAAAEPSQQGQSLGAIASPTCGIPGPTAPSSRPPKKALTVG